MECPQKQNSGAGHSISRRRFLQLSAGGLVLLATGWKTGFAQTAPYRVGVGNSPDAYDATLRAVNASQEWPSAKISGKKVIIKPNLVVGMTSDTGVTTDPEAVRALVDLALDDNAAAVIIVEDGSGEGANFSACGYDFFDSYDPRVSLHNLKGQPVVFKEITGGFAYTGFYLAESIAADDAVFISAAKMKTHSYTHATLSMKNLIGIAPVDKYVLPSQEWRWPIHNRGINQSIVDLNLARHIDYAVVEGVWAMEGNGPALGDPVRMDMVAAGQNAVAVDRVCLEAMTIPQYGVRHLTYAARKGMGPANMDNVDVLGDPITPRAFSWPPGLPPILEFLQIAPKIFSPGTGGSGNIFLKNCLFTCLRRINVVQTYEDSLNVDHVRVLRDWESMPSGWEYLTWDGRDDSGDIVPAGVYCINVEAKYDKTPANNVYASRWVMVI